MEAKRRTTSNPAAGQRATAVQVWRSLGQPQVGGEELRRIQQSINEAFGEARNISPAALARILADEGAVLRHPEVIEYDARWRESQLEHEARALQGVSALVSPEPIGLPEAESLINRLETLRGRLEHARDDQLSREIRALAIEGREVALSRAHNKLSSQAESDAQIEIAEWLRIWLQTPNLFAQWLELRKSSPDFQRKFSVTD